MRAFSLLVVKLVIMTSHGLGVRERDPRRNSSSSLPAHSSSAASIPTADQRSGGSEFRKPRASQASGNPTAWKATNYKLEGTNRYRQGPRRDKPQMLKDGTRRTYGAARRLGDNGPRKPRIRQKLLPKETMLLLLGRLENLEHRRGDLISDDGAEIFLQQKLWPEVWENQAQQDIVFLERIREMAKAEDDAILQRMDPELRSVISSGERTRSITAVRLLMWHFQSAFVFFNVVFFLALVI